MHLLHPREHSCCARATAALAALCRSSTEGFSWAMGSMVASVAFIPLLRRLMLNKRLERRNHETEIRCLNG